MRSIGSRLFLILTLTTGLVWLSAVVWIFLSTRAEVEHVLDARLMEAGRMVSSLLTSQDIDANPNKPIAAPLPLKVHSSYDRQLSCQIWSLRGTLISRSGGAPEQKLSDQMDGFSNTIIDGERWRVFAVQNAALGVRVLIGDNMRIRDRLVNDVIRGLLLPALLILPALAALIWLSIRRGLAPLNAIARDLSGRHASDLQPLRSVDTPKEITPVVQSLNGLFARVAGLRERERNFTAFAAHELRTPLAGLKTQAQVALASDDRDIRDQALRQIVIGVDRTGRLVRQLLDIAEAESGGEREPAGFFSPAEAMRSIIGELPTGTVSITVSPALEAVRLYIDPGVFRLSARNLIENAVNHSPQGGTVVCGLVEEEGRMNIVIEDEGPGIPADELPRVTERFFRGRNKAPVGSGLGLAIVELALSRAGCRLELLNRRDRGLAAMMVIPSSSVAGVAR